MKFDSLLIFLNESIIIFFIKFFLSMFKKRGAPAVQTTNNPSNNEEI
jgi:hypothetical protein